MLIESHPGQRESGVQQDLTEHSTTDAESGITSVLPSPFRYRHPAELNAAPSEALCACETVQDVIATDPDWWAVNGRGRDMRFDLTAALKKTPPARTAPTR